MKTVILAGGLGTRLSEETSVRPKPMIEIGDRPILEHIMEVYSRAGFDEFVTTLLFPDVQDALRGAQPLDDQGEAQLAGGGLGEGNSAEDADSRRFCAFEGAERSGDSGLGGRAQGVGGEECDAKFHGR